MKISVLLVALAAVVCSGCATAPRQIPLESRSRTYDAPREKVFGALLLALTNKGYAIQSADAMSGVVVTDWQHFSSNAGEFSCPGRSRYNAIVLNDGGRSRVTFAVFSERSTAVPYAPWEPKGIPKDQAEAACGRMFDALDSALTR